MTQEPAFDSEHGRKEWLVLLAACIPIGAVISCLSAVFSGIIALAMFTSVNKLNRRMEVVAIFILVAAGCLAVVGGLFAFIDCYRRKPTVVEIRRFMGAAEWVFLLMIPLTAGLIVGGRFVDAQPIIVVLKRHFFPLISSALYLFIFIITWRLLQRICGALINHSELWRVTAYATWCGIVGVYSIVVLIVPRPAVMDRMLGGLLWNTGIGAAVAAIVLFCLTIRAIRQACFEKPFVSIMLGAMRGELVRIRFLRKLSIAAVVMLIVAGLVLIPMWTRRDLTISRETTWFTEPVTESGLIDYSAALHAKYSNGVTPEHNVAVPLYQILGPVIGDERADPKLYARLGMPIPPRQGNYFVAVGDWYRDSDSSFGVPTPLRTLDPRARVEIQERFSEISQPWKREEFPLIADWIDAYSLQLDRFCHLTDESTYYCPLIAQSVAGEPETLMNSSLFGISHVRAIARALLVRSLLKINDGQVDSGWNDLISAHRFARLIGRGMTVMERWQANGIDAAAARVHLAFLQHLDLTHDQLDRFRRQFLELPDLPQLTHSVGVIDRCCLLDFAQRFLRHESALPNVLFRNTGWLKPVLWWHTGRIVWRPQASMTPNFWVVWPRLLH